MGNISDISNKLTYKQRIFLDKLSAYIETPLYFYGSIERPDYIIGKSDIDIDIFTDNIHSMIFKLQQYLNVPNDGVSNIRWKAITPYTKNFYCKKIRFKNKYIDLEINIYEEKYKKNLKKVRDTKRNLPFFVIWLLYIVKVMYYQISIIPLSTYRIWKRFILGTLIGMQDEYYVLK